MSQLALRHGPEFQRALLKTMLADRQFCFKAVHYLQDDYFSGELSWFFRKVKDHCSFHKRIPTEGEIRTEINKHTDTTDNEKYSKEFKEILAADNIGKDYLRKELTAFIRANIFVGSYQEAASLYNNGNRQGAYDFVKTKMQELYQADFEKERAVRFGEAESFLQIACNQSRDAIPTGLHAIDQAMHGGMMPQTFTLWLGGTNVGKSMVCPTLTKFAADYKNKKSFVTIHEDEVVPTYLRYLAAWSLIRFDRLILPPEARTEDENKRIKEADEKLKHYVVMRFMYGRERYIENVMDEVRMMKDQWDFDLFICDYGQCLKTNQRMDKKHDMQEYIYEELKQLCMELNIVGTGGAQVNRMGHTISVKGTDFLRVNDIGDSFGISRKVSNVITMNRSEEDKRLNRLILLLDKVRSGICPVAVQAVTDYTVCRTWFPWSETNSQQIEIPVKDGLPKNEE